MDGSRRHHDVAFVSGAFSRFFSEAAGPSGSWSGPLTITGDTRHRRACHTLVRHEIFVRSASAGNFQQTAPGRNTVHLTAHTRVCDALTRRCGHPGSDSRVRRMAAADLPPSPANLVRLGPSREIPSRGGRAQVVEDRGHYSPSFSTSRKQALQRRLGLSRPGLGPADQAP